MFNAKHLQWAVSLLLLSSTAASAETSDLNTSIAYSDGISSHMLYGHAEISVPIPIDTSLSANSSLYTGQLTDEELAELKDRDVLVIIDKSASMDKRDCPRNCAEYLFSEFQPTRVPNDQLISRWEWCKRQAMDLSGQFAKVSPEKISLVLFDNRDYIFPHIGISAIPDIFNKTQPSGGTNTTLALDDQFTNYFAKREANQTTKPLLIAIITDGAPGNSASLRDAIVRASQRIKYQGEITVSFLIIGSEVKPYQFMKELSGTSAGRIGARNITRTTSFQQLIRFGLAHSLYNAIAAVPQK